MMGSLRAIACVLVLAPAVAAAQPQPTPKQKQDASDKVKRAIAKSQSGDHESAAALYLEAYAIIPQPLLLSNVGSEYQQMKKPVEALKYFCKYLEADPTGSNVTYAKAQARTLYIELGGVTTVEDDALCKPIVKPRKEEPVSNREPDRDRDRDRDRVIADGPGPEGGTPGAKTPAIRYVGIGLAAVGVVVFGAGVYYGFEAKSISDEISNHNIQDPWPMNIKAREEEGKAAEQKQIALMIAGGVAIAAGGALYFIGAPKKASEGSLTFAPVATSDTLGLAAAGRF